MNKIFRIVWSAIRGAFIVAHEKANAHGKPSSTRQGAATALITSLLAGSGLVLAAPPVNQLPTGGQIVGGSTAGTISTNSAAMTVNQNQQRMIANWDTYSIGQSASVHYQQPTGGVALNRVNGGQPSEIFGKLTATGAVYLLNSAGIIFGKTAQVDVGALVASTGKISDADFLAGKLRLLQENAGGKVLNEGELKAAVDGYIALLAPEVRNQGVIFAEKGTVVLAAGKAYELQFNGTNLANVRVEPGEFAALVENKQVVEAPGGLIILSALAANKLQGAAIRNSGILDASSLTMKGGRIVLEASTSVENTGTITAAGSTTQLGGRVEITAPQVVQNGTVDVSGSTGGSVQIKASDSFTQGGQILAKGLAGAGGVIQLQQAQTLTLQAGSKLDASGSTQGGSVYAESANSLKVEGSVDAGSTNGVGGEITLAAGTEISLNNATLDTSGGAQGGTIKVSAKAGTHTSLADPNNPINDPTAPPQDRPNVAVTGTSVIRSSSRSRAGHVDLNADGTLNIDSAAALDATGPTDGSITLFGYNIFQSGNLAAGSVIDATASQLLFNTGTLKAGNGMSGGQITLTTLNYIDSGMVDASGTQTGGTIIIDASGSAEQASAGRMKVDGGSMAGSIRLTAGESAYLSGYFSANATHGNGGDIAITAPNLNLYGARLHADGNETGNGGSIKLGGGWHGGDATLPNANRTYINAETDISVNAGKVGAGGTAVVWSEQRTDFAGKIEAKGGSTSGDGGQVEVSSHDTLAFAGKVDAHATQGANGNLLLDPKNINIEASVSAGFTASSLSPSSVTANNSWGLPGDGYPLELANGNFIVSGRNNACGTDCGELRLFSPTGSLIATFTGTAAYDRVGAFAHGIKLQVLTNNNVVMLNKNWGSGASDSYLGKGAITWFNGSTGALNTGTIGGAVSSSNSLVGSNAGTSIGEYWGDLLGSGGARELTNGNVVVGSPKFDNTNYSGGNRGKGALTWLNGSTGKFYGGVDGGTIANTNSLLGNEALQFLGGSVDSHYGIALANGNFVYSNSLTNVAGNSNTGLALWINGSTGRVGTVDFNQVFYGTTGASSQLQAYALSNGNFVLASSAWNADAGYAFWVDGSTGLTAGGYAGSTNWSISSTTALVGDATYGRVGGSVLALSGGRYVVAGNKSATYVDPGNNINVTGTVGTGISFTYANVNGSGTPNLAKLSNGNYVAINISATVSPYGQLGDGVVTWFDGTTGYAKGETARNVLASTSNSLYGGASGTAWSYAGQGGIVELSNGNFVVKSPNWQNGFGAATWCNGSSGCAGPIDSSNSLVGSTGTDLVGNKVWALTNGNYVVGSPSWNSWKGAVTWGNGSTGTAGVVSSTNSLVGSTQYDYVGENVKVLNNGNYVTFTQYWDNGGTADVGVATWVNGSNGHLANWTSGNIGGTVSAANSLIGASANDRLGLPGSGSPGVLALSNGNYVVTTPYSFGGKGSATWGNGSSGTVGAISTSNSFTGRLATDAFSLGGTSVVALNDGNYVIGTQQSKSADQSLSNAGAVTWFNGSNGYAMNETSVGASLSTNNSYFGTTANQYYGYYIRGLTVGANAGGFVTSYPYATIGGNSSAGYLDWYKPSAAAALSGDVLFATNASADNAFTATQLKGILDAGTNLTLQANNDITLNTDLIVNNASGNGGHLTLQAGRHITFNANVTTDNGNLTAIAGDSGANATYKDAGTPTLTIAAGKTIDVGTGTATLVANGGNFINNAGNGAIATSGAGRYLVYAADPSSTAEGMSGYSKHYAQSYTGSTPAYASSGNWFLYSIAPVISVTPGSATMTYGDTSPTFGTSYASGFIDGDTAGTAGINGTASYTVGGSTSTGGRYTYGNHNVAYSNGLLSSLGYTFADNAGSSNELTVNKRDLNLSGLSVSGKTYDGTNAATITGTASLASLSGDLVSLNGSVTGGTFASTHAGTHAVTVTGLSGITGADSGNYNFISSFSATIAPATLTPTLTNAGVTKAYDGSISSSLTPTWSFSGLVAGDTAATLAYTGRNYNSKDVLAATTVTVSGLSISGITGSNGSATSDYVLDATSKTVAGTITAKSLTVSGLAASNRVYDATTDVTISNWGSVTTGVGSETLVLNHGTASFSDANAANGKTVTAVGYTLADGGNGGLASNYQLSSTSATTTANVTRKTVTLIASKTYDGTSSLTGFVTLGGFIGSETLNYTGATASNSHVASAGKYVSAITLTDGSNGGLAGNYQLPTLNAANAPLTINAATLTPTLSNTSVTKVYDGDTSTAITPTYTFAGLVAGDTAATLTNTGKLYNSKDVASADHVTVSGLAISGITGSNGSAASDYALSSTSLDVAATITRKDVSVISINIADKVYDGTTNVTSVLSTVLSGVIAADSANVNTTGTLAAFSSKDVGTYSISVTGMSLTGSAIGNYNLTSNTATDSSVAITPKTVTLSATKTYDGTTSLTGYVTLGGFIGSETLNYTGATASNSHVATASKYVSTITLTDGVSGGLASNYQLPTLNAANAPVTISAATLTPSLTNSGVAKVYDGSTASSLTPTWIFSGLVAGDTAATLAYTGRDYNSKDVLAADTVTVSGLSISSITGANSSASTDYVLDATSKTVAGAITPKTLSVSGLAASNKVYDATTDVTITNWGSVTTGVGSETLVLNQGTASFSDKNKANGKTVTAIDYALTDGGNGGLASNYQLSSTSATTTANITAKMLTLAGSSGLDKTYDGRTSMPVGNDGYGGLVGVVGGDTVAITGAPVYDSANAGSRSILVGTVGITGLDAGNYALTWTNGSGTIAKAPLSVSANADAKFVTQGDVTGSYNGVSYAGFVNGENTSALNIAGLTITRSNSSQNNAGSYGGVLVPSGVTAANYQITYTAGDYTIVPAGQLLVRVNNASTTYGTGATYSVIDARYMDGSNVIHTLAAPSQSGDTFTYSDGVGGNAVFTLGPVTPQTSTAGQLKAGVYGISASNISETSANFSNSLTVVGGLTVTPKALTANATNVSKVYDGTTAMTNVVLGYTGLESGDLVTIAGNGNFSDKNVGTGKSYAVTSLTLGSSDAANYYLSGGDTFSGNNGEITPKTVSLAATRTYDGTHTLDASALTISTGVGTETLTFSGATAHSKNVGAGNYVDAITLLDGTNGGLASNYQLPSLTAANADNGVSITQKTLTLASLTAADRIYDGTTNATLTVGNLLGLVGSETLTLTSAGNFSDPNVGIGKTVLAQLTLADGTGLAGNYTISDATTTATINPVPNVVPPLPPSVPPTPPAPPSVPDPTPPATPDGGSSSGGTSSGSGSGSSSGGTTSGSGSSSGGDTSSGSGSGSSSGGTTSGSGSSSGGDTSSGSGSGSSSGGTTSGSGSSSGGDTSSGSGSGSSSGGTTSGSGSGSGADTSSGSGSSSGGDTSSGSGSGSSSGGTTSGSGSSSGGDTSSGSGSGSSSGGTTSGSGSSSGGDTSSGSGSGSSSGGTTSGSGSSSGGDTSSGSGSGSSSGGTTSGSGSSSGGDTSGGSGSGGRGSDTGSGLATNGTSAGRNSAEGKNEGQLQITVTLLKHPTETVTGAILVEVPGEIGRTSGGFSFQLPQELVELAKVNRTQPEATLVNGDPLPPWLRFTPETNMFVAKGVPNGGLPIQVVVKIGRTRTVLLVTERNG